MKWLSGCQASPVVVALDWLLCPDLRCLALTQLAGLVRRICMRTKWTMLLVLELGVCVYIYVADGCHILPPSSSHSCSNHNHSSRIRILCVRIDVLLLSLSLPLSLSLSLSLSLFLMHTLIQWTTPSLSTSNASVHGRTSQACSNSSSTGPFPIPQLSTRP